MTSAQKRQRLHGWLVQKFSLDPQKRCMLPGPGSRKKPRNDACWHGFEITDAELKTLVSDTMDAYSTDEV